MSGWRSLAYGAARPLLFRLDSERIHRLTLHALRAAGDRALGRALLRVAAGAPTGQSPWVELAGLEFRNRVGLGAGFDKDAMALRAWAGLGLGFVEVGTVTPGPQPGNRRPRLFRLPRDGGLVNRMGFNNAGAVALARRVMLARRHLPRRFVVGVNIGRGRHTPLERAADDYLGCARLVRPVADYLAINVSSPNTPGLRELQDRERLVALVRALAEAGAAAGQPRPLLVKLSPDLSGSDVAALATSAVQAGAAGVILANSTTRRDGLVSPEARESGGLSGAPLLPTTLAAVRRAREALGREAVIVASGGIGSAEAVAAAYDAGADLVQLWTGLVYAGPGLIGDAVRAHPVR
ncbi:MAG TPA: quinone-dependent dihydroorotate dehydrogenase [Candidatus Limnocylindria bacterium]|nr:quinone-dependent dihydroorotate dehydrogenase [Candidatus Limnocylindria bacterium]